MREGNRIAGDDLHGDPSGREDVDRWGVALFGADEAGVRVREA